MRGHGFEELGGVDRGSGSIGVDRGRVEAVAHKVDPHFLGCLHSWRRQQTQDGTDTDDYISPLVVYELDAVESVETEFPIFDVLKWVIPELAQGRVDSPLHLNDFLARDGAEVHRAAPVNSDAEAADELPRWITRDGQRPADFRHKLRARV